jgi:hypothetical protein
LVKIALTACGFSQEEVDHFIKHTSTDLLELTWHTETKSRNVGIPAQRDRRFRTNVTEHSD